MVWIARSVSNDPRTYPHAVPNIHAAITGLGIVSPIGIGLSDWREALRMGRSGLDRLDFSHPGMRSTVAARCSAFDPKAVMSEPDLARLPKLIPMALHAGTQALASAGLEAMTQSQSQRTGLILGTGAGGIDFTLDQARAAYAPEGGKLSLWTITNATHGNLAGELSIRLGLHGPSWCTSTGCGSSSDALAQALMLIRQGTCDRVLVLGADAHIRWETLTGMELLKVISTRDWSVGDESPTTASRPFDASRDGFVLGEGAWAILIERPGLNDDARFGDLLGSGVTCDAYHRVRPEPSMEESARAMTLAISDAGLRPSDISVLHYHGTATVMNDICETRAVRLAFADHADRLIGHSVKSQIGHPQGASGAAAVAATLAGLTRRENTEPFISPTINLTTPGQGCDLDYTPGKAKPMDTQPTYALVNCLAFGAKNSALVLKI